MEWDQAGEGTRELFQADRTERVKEKSEARGQTMAMG